MRRTTSHMLLALAAFFTALSPLLRWYAFPRRAKIPANQYQDMVLEARGRRPGDSAPAEAVEPEPVSA